MATPVYIPLLNTNEPEALLVDIYVQAGQYVQPGDLLCCLETTKSTEELQAQTPGYIIGLSWKAGQTAIAGNLFCYLAEKPDWQPEQVQQPASLDPLIASVQTAQNKKIEIPSGLRITKPALALAEKFQVDLNHLPEDVFITEAVVRAAIEKKVSSLAWELDADRTPFDANAIIVYGGGGHGKSVIELLRALGCYRIAGIIDDGLPVGQSILGIPLLGGGDLLQELFEHGIRLAANAVGGIGNIAVRIKVSQKLAQAGFACPTIIHPTAYVEPSAQLAAGIQIFPHAYIGSDVAIGYGSIVNTSAVVSHDCTLGNYVNISPGALLAGEVHVGNGVLIGMGSTINLQVHVGAGARVGNGATVKSDVPEKGVVRAGAIWPD